MIPYFTQPKWELGPFTIHAFGVLVAIGILLGTHLADRRSVKMGLDPNVTARMVIWVVLGGFIGAHLVESLFYSPRQTWQDPIRLLKIWQGISSFGGFLGAIVGALWFIKRERMGVERWHYLDAITWAFPFAWFFGRCGCSVAHDHKGIASDFFLAVKFPPSMGGTRLDLGIIEALLTLLWIASSLLLGRKSRAPGYISGVLATVYAPIRFGLDFLRTDDRRYMGLTPGQYAAIGLFLFGLWIIYHSRSLAEHALVPGASSGPEERSDSKTGGSEPQRSHGKHAGRQKARSKSGKGKRRH